MKTDFSKIAGLENDDKYRSFNDWCDEIGSGAIEVSEDEAEGVRATYWDGDAQEDVEITLRQKRSGWGWWGGRYGTDQIYHDGWTTPAGAIVAAWKKLEYFKLV